MRNADDSRLDEKQSGGLKPTLCATLMIPASMRSKAVG
jgi:hypothetical protein